MHGVNRAERRHHTPGTGLPLPRWRLLVSGELAQRDIYAAAKFAGTFRRLHGAGIFPREGERHRSRAARKLQPTGLRVITILFMNTDKSEGCMSILYS